MVRSNGLVVDPELLAPMVATDLSQTSADDLRSRFHDNGYLLLRGALPRQQVSDVGQAYLRELAAADPQARNATYGTAGHPAHEFVRGATFDRFTRSPELKTLAETLLAGPVALLPRRILRHFTAGSTGASRAHIDFDYLDRGTDRIVTAWIPLLDCPLAGGGLVYLEGSHRSERTDLDELREFTDRPQDQRAISNDLGLTAQRLGGRWLWTDYEVGDIVVHSPHLVHASLDNASDGDRLSADVRYRLAADNVDDRWLAPWSADDGN